MLKVSFVFSFRNEEENIPELIRRTDLAISSTGKAVEYEMIFVNDASTDNSKTILSRLQDQYPIKIINMSRRFGGTPCMLAGFKHAKGDAIIYLDSDLQDPPELIPEMIEKFNAGADVVHMTRIKREGEGWLKLRLTKLAYKLINLFSEIRLPENTGDFKLLSARVARHIVELEEYDPYMRGLSVWVGYKQEYIYYNREPRYAGETKFPIFSSAPIKEFLRGVTTYSAAPLYLSFFLGGTACLVALFLMIWTLISKFFGNMPPGVSGILVAIAFFSGMVLLTNGIMGIYVAKIFYEVKRRPKYIISEVMEMPQKAKIKSGNS